MKRKRKSSEKKLEGGKVIALLGYGAFCNLFEVCNMCQISASENHISLIYMTSGFT